MSDKKTYGGFVRDYDPRKPNMHSIFRAEDDPRTLSPEMDEWKRMQIAKQISASDALPNAVVRHAEDNAPHA